VVEPYKKGLEIVGVGYNAQVSGKKLTLQLGFASPVVFEIPEEVVVQVPDPTHVNISGVDKQKVGQFAAEIRRVKGPEPYKGKGIRYIDEVVKRKPGKAFVGAAT
jgi:large subunit ribosomal protein L6